MADRVISYRTLMPAGSTPRRHARVMGTTCRPSPPPEKTSSLLILLEAQLTIVSLRCKTVNLFHTKTYQEDTSNQMHFESVSQESIIEVKIISNGC